MNSKLKPSEERRWEKYYPENVKNFDFPRMKTYDLVYEENKNRKDNIALEYEGTNISYGEFFDKVEEKTEFFQDLGVKENDIVTCSMLMSPEFVYDWYALGRLNAISNLIDPRTSANGIKEYLDEAKSSVVINTDIFTSKLKEAITTQDIKVINYSLNNSATKMPLLLGGISLATGLYSSILGRKDNRFINYQDNLSIGSVEIPDYQENQALTIVHTGGTTGVPKGVILSHDNYNAMAYEYKSSGIGFAEKDRFLLIMPPWISYGSGMLHMSLVVGMKATIISKLDSKKMPNYLNKYQPQWFAGVPAHYKIVNGSKLLAKNGVSYIKGCAVGGDAMSSELFLESEQFLKENGASKGVYPGYALTEATSAFAVRQLEPYKPGSVGIPLPGCTMGIFKFDEETETTKDEELDYNMRGEICLRTPNQMLGYFNNSNLTEQVLRKHKDGYIWIHTGDLGYIDEDGILYVDGRIKEMITRYDGFKIYPFVIDKLVSTNKAIFACKTVGVPDNIHGVGNYAKTYIVLKPEYENQEKQIIKEIKEVLQYCLPSYYTEGLNIEVTDELPITSVGKVDFETLKELNEKKVLRRVKIRS